MNRTDSMSFAIARIALALLTLVVLPEAKAAVSSFSYDDAPVLRCANCASNPIQYTYDGQNVQVKTQKGALVNYSLYASNGDLLGIYDAAGAPIKEYAYLAGKQVAMYTASTGAATSYHLDPAGSPLAATNATGALLWRETYRPYGERLKVQDGGTNTLWFAGEVQDVTTGLSYLGARYYDPAIGRFMAVDPVGFAEQNLHSFNRYAYANNNPYKFVDPDGRAADLILDIGFIGYDIYKLATEPSWTNAAALGGDVLGAAVPFVTGVGSGIRAAAHADEAADLLRGADAAGGAASATGKLARYDGAKPSYSVNPSHVPGRTLRPGKTQLPNDAADVFKGAVPNDPNNPTAWFGKNADGQIYRYSLGGDGSAHFSGIHGVGDGTRNITRYAIDRLNGL
jgi:RHS repeat-associated protein